MRSIQIISIFAIFCLVFYSCKQTPEEKAMKLIKSFVKNESNDPGKYESISFGKLDSVYSSSNMDSIYIKYAAKKYSYYIQRSLFNNKLRDSAEYYKRALNGFNPKHSGWKMEHTYRATNGFGALVKETSVFILDKDLTKVTDVKNSNLDILQNLFK